MSSHIGCCRSPEDLGIAAEDDPSSLADKVPKLKAVLMQEEARKALHRLRPLMNSDDASLDFMKVGSCTGEDSCKSALANVQFLILNS